MVDTPTDRLVAHGDIGKRLAGDQAGCQRERGGIDAEEREPRVPVRRADANPLAAGRLL